MPDQVYTLTIDGQKQRLKWSGDKPPTDSEISDIVKQYHAPSSSRAATETARPSVANARPVGKSPSPSRQAPLLKDTGMYSGLVGLDAPETMDFHGRMLHTSPTGDMFTGHRANGLLTEEQAQQVINLRHNPAVSTFGFLTDQPIQSGINMLSDIRRGHAVDPNDAAMIAQIAGGGLMYAETRAPALGASLAERLKAASPSAHTPAAGPNDLSELFADVNKPAEPVKTAPKSTKARTAPKGKPNAAVQTKPVEGPTAPDVPTGKGRQVAKGRSTGQGAGNELQRPAGTQAAAAKPEPTEAKSATPTGKAKASPKAKDVTYDPNLPNPDAQRKVLASITGKTHIDEISSKSGVSPTITAVELTKAEMAGKVRRLPNSTYEAIVERSPEAKDVAPAYTGPNYSERVTGSSMKGRYIQVRSPEGTVHRVFEKSTGAALMDPNGGGKVLPAYQYGEPGWTVESMHATKPKSWTDVTLPEPKSGTLNVGFGTKKLTGSPDDPALISVDKVKQGVHAVGDAASNLFSEAAAYTRRTAPPVFNNALRMVNSHQEAEAGMEKIRSVFDKHGFGDVKSREAIGAIINADKQLSKGVTPSVPKATIQKFAANPKGKAFLKDYNQAVTELYADQRKAAGYGENNVFGKHTGAYMPSVGLDTEGVPYSKASVGGGAGLTRPSFTPSKVPGEAEFTGKGKYLNDPLAAHHNRLIGLNRSAGERSTLKSMYQEGALQVVPKDFNGTVTYKGTSTKAVKVNLQNWGFTPQEMEKIGLPTVKVKGQLQGADVVMPARVASEMEPLFHARSKATDNPFNIYDKAIMAQLYSLGELGAHSVTLPSVGGSALAPKGITGSVPFANSVRGMSKMLNVGELAKKGYAAEDVANANVLAARAGIRRSYPTNPDMTPKEKLLETVKNPGGSALYARKGLFNNMVTGIYKTMKATGATDDAIVETMRALPGHTKQLEAGVPAVFKRLGLGTYYNTGKSVMKQTFNPAGGAKTLAYRTTGAIAFVTAAGKLRDKDHKFWWEQGLAPGEYVADRDKDGTPVVGTVSYDRVTRTMLETPARVTRAYKSGATPTQIAAEGVAGSVSQAVRPLTGGPVSAIAQQVSGKAPYVVRKRDSYGMDTLDIPESKLSYSNPDRVMGMLRSLVPILGYTEGDAPAKYSSTAPHAEKWRVVNLWLRRFGQPGFKRRSPEQDKVYEQINEMKRQANERKATERAQSHSIVE